MIKIIQGDLLEAKENIIAHQVNCKGVMGSGVAKQIKQKYNKAFNDYKNLITRRAVEELLGRVQYVPIADKKYIANLFGQYKYGYDGIQYTNIEALSDCLFDLRKEAEKYELSVALPYMIGSDRGGADWKEVEGLIIDAFEGYEVALYKLKR